MSDKSEEKCQCGHARHSHPEQNRVGDGYCINCRCNEFHAAHAGDSQVAAPYHAPDALHIPGGSVNRRALYRAIERMAGMQVPQYEQDCMGETVLKPAQSPEVIYTHVLLAIKEFGGAPEPSAEPEVLVGLKKLERAESRLALAGEIIAFGVANLSSGGLLVGKHRDIQLIVTKEVWARWTELLDKWNKGART